MSLVDRIAEALCSVQDRDLGVPDERTEVAEAVVAVAYPRIETVEQLDALAVGSVVIDDMADVLQLHNEDGGWRMAGFEGLHIPILPAILLYTPGDT